MVFSITSKALLFLSAGSVIHAVSDEQDMRKMGGLKNLVPFTYSMLIIGSLALVGFPFLAGFYSKDLILEVAYGKYSLSGYFSYYLGTLSAFFTAFYSMRLAYLTFLSRPAGYKQVICFAFDSGFYICIVLASLAIPSIFIGYYIKDMLVGVGSSFFGTAIFVSATNANTFDGEFVDVLYKILPVVLSIVGFFFSYALYNFGSKFLFRIKMSTIGKKVYCFLNRKWFFDKIYKCGVLIFQCLRLSCYVNVIDYRFKVGHFLNRLVDQKVVRDHVFSNSTGKRIFFCGFPLFWGK
jgi:NADH-ubiquinone oxidoreductase chain 5